ncbi:MAG: NlpC/P60 family protein [Pseudomonadota bacterium]
MTTLRVITPAAWLYETPSNDSRVTSQLLYGERVDIEGERGDWRHVTAQRDGYTGWIDAACLGSLDQNAAHHVCVPYAPLYASPDIKHAPTGALPLNSVVTLGGPCVKEHPAFMPLAGGGFLIASHVTNSPKASDPLAVAKTFLGTPYAWAGRTYLGMDCSGLVQMALWACGRPCPRDSGDQWSKLGQALGDKDSPQEGDLVFFPGHVGFYIGAGALLHANATHMCTTIDPLEDVISWVAREHDAPLTGFKRIL